MRFLYNLGINAVLFLAFPVAAISPIGMDATLRIRVLVQVS